jgi:hypothetical protein
MTTNTICVMSNFMPTTDCLSQLYLLTGTRQVDQFPMDGRGIRLLRGRLRDAHCQSHKLVSFSGILVARCGSFPSGVLPSSQRWFFRTQL